MATYIRSLADSSQSTSPNSSLINIYQNGITTLQIFSDEGSVTIGATNYPKNIVHTLQITAATFPSGINAVYTPDSTVLSPSVITFGSSTTTQNVVNWTLVPSATSYVVKRSVNADMSNSTTIYTGALLTKTDTGLTAGTTYYYQVTASAVGYTNSLSAISSKSTSASTGGFNVALNITGIDSADLPITYPSPFNSSGVANFTNDIEEIAFSYPGYTAEPLARYFILASDGNQTLTFNMTKVSTEQVVTTFDTLSGCTTDGAGNVHRTSSAGVAALAVPTFVINEGEVGYMSMKYVVPFADSATLTARLNIASPSNNNWHNAFAFIWGIDSGFQFGIAPDGQYDNFVTATTGQLVRHRVTLTNLLIERSLDNGATWSILKSGARPSGILKFKIEMDGGAYNALLLKQSKS